MRQLLPLSTLVLVSSLARNNVFFFYRLFKSPDAGRPPEPPQWNPVCGNWTLEDKEAVINLMDQCCSHCPRRPTHEDRHEFTNKKPRAVGNPEEESRRFWTIVIVTFGSVLYASSAIVLLNLMLWFNDVEEDSEDDNSEENQEDDLVTQEEESTCEIER